MGKTISPYYPPRAHWYGRLLTLGERVRIRLVLDGLRPPPGVPWLGLLASVFVPGLGFYLRGPRHIGRAALASCALLLVIFVTELGRPPANIAFGLLLAAHATGINYLLAPFLAASRFRVRLIISMGLLIALGTLLYLPGLNFFNARGLTPLRIRDRVVIVHQVADKSKLRRGDLIAYSLPENGNHDGYILAGYGLGPILATGGDRVHFTPAALEINGRPQPRLEYMPDSGELVVPGNSWLIWPKVDITGHGNVPGSTLAQTMLSMAVIGDSQIAGKPFKRWFWHRQFPL